MKRKTNTKETAGEKIAREKRVFARAYEIHSGALAKGTKQPWSESLAAAEKEIQAEAKAEAQPQG